MTDRGQDQLGSGWLFVAHPNAALDDLAELVGPVSDRETGEPLFPSEAFEGRCRICGKIALLTEEHLPPRGAFNKGRGRSPGLEELLGREDVDPPDTGVMEQGGVRGFMLCGSCNNYTGTRWSREYQEWARRAALALASVPGGIAAVDAAVGFPGWDELTFKSVYPARYVRQVLSMMLSISGSSELGDRLPVLRRLVLGGDPEPLPEPVRLYMLIVAGPMARIAGGPDGQLWVDLEARARRRVLAVDFPPLAHTMIVEGNPAPELGVDISTLTEYELDTRTDVSFKEIPLGFTYKPWPTDYRSRGQLLRDRETTD